MRDLLIVFTVFLATAAAVFRPFIGFLAYVCLGILAPHSVGWGLSRTLPLSQIVAGGLLLGFIFSRERKTIEFTRETVLLILLFATFGRSTLFAIYQDLAWPRLVYVAKIYVVVFLGISLTNSRDRIRMVLYVIVFSIGFYAVKGGSHLYTDSGISDEWAARLSTAGLNFTICTAN